MAKIRELIGYLKSFLSNFSPSNNDLPAVSLSRNDLWIAVGLAGIVVLLGYWQMIVGVCGVYHDDAIYIITAKALAQGKGYRLINLPDSPLQTKYPILYPAMLAIIWKIWPSFPKNLAAMQGLSLFSGSVFIALSYLYLVRYGYATRGVALAATLLSATAVFYIYFSTQTLSETTYAFISILALWAVDRQVRLPFDKISSQILIGFLLALPFLTRTIGIVIVPAGLLILYLKGRRIRWIALGAALVVLPWILWILIGPKWDQNKISLYYTNYLSWWVTFGWLSLVRVIIINLIFIGKSIAGIVFGYFYKLLQNITIVITSMVIFFVIVTVVALFRQLNCCRMLPYYLAGYLLFVIIWPWMPLRFIIPILPLILAFFLIEIHRMAKKYLNINKKVIYVIGLTICLFFNLMLVRQAEKASRAMCYPYTLALSQPICWSSFENIFNWIKHHTHPNDTLAAGLDTMMYLYTGRKAFRPFVANPLALFYSEKLPIMTTQALIHLFKVYRPKYLIQTPMPGFAEAQSFTDTLRKIVDAYPGWLKPVFIGEDERFRIFEIQPKLQPQGNF